MRFAAQALAFALFATLLPSTAAAQSASGPHVVLVSLDAFPAERLEDESLELSNLRALIRSGVWAESSETVFPGTDHPAHTSILTGVPPAVHGVIGNRLLNRETGDYFHVTNRPRRDVVKVPTLFDAAKAAGLSTAAFFWPETKDDPAVDRGIAAVLTGDGKADIAGADPIFLEELREAEIPIDLFFEWYNDLALQTTADRILTRAAAYVLERYRPNLLAIRLPAMDRYQHQYGPEHYLSKAAFTAADYNVGILRRAAEQAGIARDTTFLVVSDHGFHEIGYTVNVHPVFVWAGLTEKVNLQASYWSVVVELTDAFDPSRDQRRLDQALERALALDGITRVIRPEELEAIGLPRYEDDPHMPGHYIIVGDIDTRADIDEESESTSRVRLDRPFYGHGFLPTHEKMYPLFVAAGRRVAEGKRIGHIHNYDIAPTVAELLGLRMSGLHGRVLNEMLTK